jgi:ketosteroid isomerase-like protein
VLRQASIVSAYVAERLETHARSSRVGAAGSGAGSDVMHRLSHARSVAGMAGDPTAVVDRYLALLSDHSTDHEDIAELLDPAIVFVERPNHFQPNGSERDRDTILAAVSAGRGLLREQRFDVLDHLVDGDRVVSRVHWSGTLAVDVPGAPAGTTIEADSSMHFTVRDGRITHQENYDCFHPFPAPA